MLALLYRFSDIVILIASLLAVLLTKVVVPWKRVYESAPVLVTIAVTFASFLFAGQSILISLPSKNEFLELAEKNGYVRDFHKFCRRAELVYAAIAFPLMFLTKQGAWLDLLMLLIFFYAFGNTFWALFIFGSITKHYSRYK